MSGDEWAERATWVCCPDARRGRDVVDEAEYGAGHSKGRILSAGEAGWQINTPVLK